MKRKLTTERIARLRRLYGTERVDRTHPAWDDIGVRERLVDEDEWSRRELAAATFLPGEKR